MAKRSGIGSLTNSTTAISAKAGEVRSANKSSKVYAGFSKKSVTAVSNIPLFKFTAPDTEVVRVPYDQGGLIAGAKVRSSFAATRTKSATAGHSGEYNYRDKDFIDFLKTPNGSIFLHNQNVRRPIHILADFDYATLNKVLDPREPNHEDSGAARMWARNANARAWRNWVANSLVLEMALGPEGSVPIGPSHLRRMSGDSMTAAFDGAAVRTAGRGTMGVTKDLFNNGINKWVLHNLIDGYTLVYYLEDFISQTFTLNPYVEPEPQKALILAMWLGYYFEDNDPILSSIAGKLARRFRLVLSPDRDGPNRLQPEFSFLPTQRQSRLLLRLHHPADQQGFIKSVIESTRVIAHYLRTGEFCYRSTDTVAAQSNDEPGWLADFNFNHYVGGIKTIHGKVYFQNMSLGCVDLL